MTSQTVQQTITIHIFPNISKSKDNQVMNFGQFIEYNVRKKCSLKIMQKERQGD